MKQDEYISLLKDAEKPTIDSTGEEQKVLHGTISCTLNAIWSRK